MALGEVLFLHAAAINARARGRVGWAWRIYWAGVAGWAGFAVLAG